MKERIQRCIAVYSRKSRFTGKGESIENQIELCRQYIAVQFGECEGERLVIYEDEGFSGGNLERPQFKRMMDDARAGRFSAIVVYRLDRISRNIGDFAGLIQELADRKIAFVSIKEQFDTSSPMGRAMMYIASVFSQLERETIAERIRDNMHELSKTGRWLGGTTPTGYASEAVQRVTVDGKVKKACKLKLIPEEAAIVALIFKTFLETGSLTQTDTFLLQNGYFTKNNKRFTRFAIKNILTNPVYMTADADAHRYLVGENADLFSQEADFDGAHGVMAYNRTIQQAGKANRLRPVSEWIVSVGRHKGLISGENWIRAQALLAQNRSKTYRRPRSNVALLSGLLVCGNCGDYMRPKLSTRLDARGEPIYPYLCSMKERSRGHCCSIRNAAGNLLDQAVVEEVKKLSAEPSEFIRQLEQGKKALTMNREGRNADLERLRQGLEESEKEIKALVSSLTKASGTSAEEYIMAQIDELHDKGEGLRRRLEELSQLTEEHALSDIEFDILRELLTTFRDTIDDLSVEQKRAAIRTCVRKVVWDGENVHIYLFGSEGNWALPEHPFPGQGRKADDAGARAATTARAGARIASGGSPQPLGEDSK